MKLSFIIFLSCVAVAVYSAHNFEEYSFHRKLNEQYELHWKFNLQTETIQFAVKVQTQGWVGFGISPNGRMSGSDVIIGWVDNTAGTSHFNDRFAEKRELPSIDSQQNWFLVTAEQENGYTILEFYRNFTSCDDKDLDITSGTTRVIWSWHTHDPVNGVFQRHTTMGSTSLSLLGGLSVPRSEPQDGNILTITAKNVTIPGHKDTTYWCQTRKLSSFKNKEIYIYKISPNLSPHSMQYVHHIVVYTCGNDVSPGYEVDCDAGNNRTLLGSCFTGEILAAWAVGGENFTFPENVTLPFNTSRTILLEIHYDNPMQHTGVIDSSGVNFHYTVTPSTHLAGCLTIGSSSVPTVIIPPNAENFVYDSLCSSSCLDRYLPENGVKFFATLLHTHLVGKGLIVKHIRNKSGYCGATEELEPIDKDLQYDFNYQRINHLPNEIHLQRGESLQLQCIYQTMNKRKSVTLGGLGTRNEMCVAFLYYYPKIGLPFCGQHPNHSLAYNKFIDEHLKHNSTAMRLAKISLHTYNATGITDAFDQIQWTNATVQQFESAVRNAQHYQLCFGNHSAINPNIFYPENLPSVNCSYEPPNKCMNLQPQSCCERLQSLNSGVTQLCISLFTILALMIITLILIQ